MTGPGHDGVDGTPSEEALEDVLTRMGPLLRRRREVGTPDLAFTQRLRARLAPEVVAAPVPVVPAIRTWPLHPARVRGVRVAVGLVAALAALAAVGLIAAILLVSAPPRPHTPPAAWRPPVPSLADLTRGFPAPLVARAQGAQGTQGALTPTLSLAAHLPGVPYTGRVILRTTHLPARAFHLSAFRLAAPATVATRIAPIARALGVRAPLQRVDRGGERWVVESAAARMTRRSRGSVAVSLATGELIYHGAFDARATRREVWRDNAAAVAAARAWLARLGWPGDRAPLGAVEHSGLPRNLREIKLGWVGVGAAATDAATLWVTPGGRVVEADVWPPVEGARSIRARDVAAAWTEVRGRRAPLAVEGVPPNTRVPGVGVMRHITIAHVLSTGTDRRLYLVPTYHFAGAARRRGVHGGRVCYALTPAGADV